MLALPPRSDALFCTFIACMSTPDLHRRCTAFWQLGLPSEVTQGSAQQSICLPPGRGWAWLNWHLNPCKATAASSTQNFANSLIQRKYLQPKTPPGLQICSGIHLCAVNEVSGVLQNCTEGANWNRAELVLGEGVWAVEFSDYTYVISKGALHISL